MAIRRTREDKLQAKMRREEGKYSWQPAAEKVKEIPEKPRKIAERKDQPEVEKYFRKDLKRTLTSVLIIVSLLFLAWYLFGR